MWILGLCYLYIIYYGVVIFGHLHNYVIFKYSLKLLWYITVIEPENETSWNRGFSDFNENRHKDGNLGLHDYEGQQKVIFFNFGKISISGW